MKSISLPLTVLAATFYLLPVGCSDSDSNDTGTADGSSQANHEGGSQPDHEGGAQPDHEGGTQPDHEGGMLPDEYVPDVVTCAAPMVLHYESPGCGISAPQPVCGPPNGDACRTPFCGCDGVTVGDCGFTSVPYAYQGPCTEEGVDAGDAGDAQEDATDGHVEVDASSEDHNEAAAD